MLLGDRLEVVSEHDGWLEVTVPDGYRGYVRAAAVESSAAGVRPFVVTAVEAGGRFMGTMVADMEVGTESLVDARGAACGTAVVETARLFLGVPYEWGGVTCAGIDCSGLVQTVHRRFGTLLPRDADDQEAAGEPVEGEPLPGDLYCFGDHIAIAAGDGLIVHAAGSHGRVVEEPLPADLAARMLAVRRIYASA